MAEGPQAVAEAVRAGGVTEVFATEAALSRHTGLLAEAESFGARVFAVADSGLAALTDTVHPQGIVAVCGYVDTTLPETVRLAVVLDGIADPGNAGTILRTADAAGAQAVVFPHGSVDPYNGKCVRASVGSLFHLPVVRGGDTDEHLDALRAKGLRILAADVRGETDLDAAIDDGLLRQPTAWLFGSEAHGLSDALTERADVRVRVPIYGAAESLNLATAAAVCLYASAREHRKGET
ncbi:tRNA/rRNA methyltransferase (SpoU) [Stackebrandtia nassauensis DSM 44728]|uniref:tRNA/rRNA methyltransferase (SpoU) n=2 Tax=Stackebrandtia TaxID=283810 RepID=D3QAE3_STANL|nr:RNA methyltransferase [Stackebrandtia nassauensis]ADD42726.1 tRNA/rRNA methyltransferase (SpoU) [Stackebrandtia nassauensis DSM 44728]